MGHEARYCSGCGEGLAPGAVFCSRCGAPVGGAAPAAPPPPAPSVSDGLGWQIDVPVLGNRIMRGAIMKGCLLTVVISAVGLGAILGFASGEAETGLKAAGFAAAGALALFGLGFGGYLVLVGFNQPIAYRLDAEGITMLNASRVAKGVHRTATIAGLLAGNLSAVAAGSAAERSEVRQCAWAEVRFVEEHPSDLTLIVRGGMLSTIQVFCTPENYAQARDFIFSRVRPAGA